MKSIFITGASSGIGAELALYYAAPGVTLHLLARRADRLTQVADKCRSKGAKVYFHQADVTDRAALQTIVTAIEAETPLDLVIANAGISGGTGGMGIGKTFDQDHQIFDVNVNGVLNTIHPVLPAMIARGRGQVAIVSSLASYLSLPGAPAYTASKAAVRAYGEALAVKLKPLGVHVTIICPGFIVSEMTAANDFSMPFIMPTDKAVRVIAAGLAQQKSHILFPFAARLATFAIKLLPTIIQNQIFMALPEKKGLILN